jgi:tRNA threonylcarbamoyladenosine biosynthesis protein TsaB
VTLALDASTYEGSVAVIRGRNLIAERTVAMRGEREERLMPAVASALAQAGVAAGELARIVCGAGPGSFTSLRIAASIAKGIAMATGVPLFAVSSLRLAQGHGDRTVVTLDAMRGEVFASAGSGYRVLGTREAEEWAASIGAVPVAARPHARAVEALLPEIIATGPVDASSWEPDYGRKAEAQVKWEAEQGRPLVG